MKTVAVGHVAPLTDTELLQRFPGVAIDLDNRQYYHGLIEHRLLINRCDDCGSWHRYPGPMCSKCWSLNIVPTAVSGRGKVHLLIFLHQGARTAPDTPPYPIATVELEEQAGLRFTSTVINCTRELMHVNMPVQLAWENRNGAPYPAFEPAVNAG